DKELNFNVEGEDINFNLDEIIAKWEEPLEEIFPTRTADCKDTIEGNVEAVNYTERNTAKPKVTTDKPYVVIPVFPG
ncbi:hypothetical protein RFZ44_24095, partial [Acinetobacter sp. 163]|nr:hypothetical protein [Acinetobacter sp. 163]